MALKCSICTNSRIEEINADLIKGVSTRHIASQYGVGYKSVQRHKKHLPQKAIVAGAREQVAIAVRMGKSTIEHLDDLIAKVDTMVSQCETEKDRKNFIAGIRELRECRTLVARLTGELGPNNQVNVAVNVPSVRDDPAFPIVLKILRECPVCFKKVEAALRGEKL